ncbi:MAG: hypothetical protein LBL91_00670 [Lachnospiraceae bacterium]|nr:hypothetical protein [Lachnospiraceae bacterium]
MNTNRYFKEIYVEENDSISSGENILKYTNGTYLTAPYDCIIAGISLPEALGKCTSSNYISVESTNDLYVTLSISEDDISNVAIRSRCRNNNNCEQQNLYWSDR